MFHNVDTFHHVDTDQIIGLTEAAEIAGVSVETLRRRIAAGVLPTAAKAPGLRGAWLVWRSDIEQLVG